MAPWSQKPGGGSFLEGAGAESQEPVKKGTDSPTLPNTHTHIWSAIQFKFHKLLEFLIEWICLKFPLKSNIGFLNELKI